MRIYKQVFAIAILIMILATCTIGFEPDTSAGEGEDVAYYIATPQMYQNDSDTVFARAVAPIWQNEHNQLEDGIIDNYPIPGQRTDWEVTALPAAMYRIQSTTSYPYTSLIIDTVETYYVYDANDNGVWDDGDRYVDSDGNIDTTFREEFATRFSNGDVRTETIVMDSYDPEFALPEDISQEYTFASLVEYEQQSTIVDGAASKITGTRWYVETDTERRTYIYEEGMIVNPEIEGRPRGRVDVRGEITIVDGLTLDRTITGFYELTSRSETWRIEL